MNRLVGLLCLVVSVTAACAAPEVAKEKRSSTTSSLGKPQASIRTAASKETTAKYGIKEWQIFRGKKELVMTGFDKDGEAVKGVSVEISKSDDDEEQLVTRIHDGSKFVAARSFATQKLAADGEIPAPSADFLKQILGDLGGLSSIFTGGGLGDIALPETQAACGADVTAVLNQALQCTGAAASKAAQAACISAAKNAAASGASCENVGAVDATDQGDGTAAGGIDLSQLGIQLPTIPTGGADGAGIDLSQILQGGLQNPFDTSAEGGGLSIQNPFGDAGLGDIFGSADTGAPGFGSLFDGSDF